MKLIVYDTRLVGILWAIGLFGQLVRTKEKSAEHCPVEHCRTLSSECCTVLVLFEMFEFKMQRKAFEQMLSPS